MAREYVLQRRAANIDENVNGEDYLARTVHEDHELIDIGVMDAQGNRIMARRRMDPIGFVRWPETM